MPAATGGAGDPKYYRKPEEVGKIYEVRTYVTIVSWSSDQTIILVTFGVYAAEFTELR